MALSNGLWNDGPIDSLLNSWGSWPSGYVVEFGGAVTALAVTPGSVKFCNNKLPKSH